MTSVVGFGGLSGPAGPSGAGDGDDAEAGFQRGLADARPDEAVASEDEEVREGGGL